MSTKSYRPWLPGQPLLLPPDIRRWLPDDHLVWFVLDLVDALDISPIEDALQAKDPRGTRPYDPRMMVALLLYAYAVGVYSSRRIERATYEDLAFRVLTADQHPDHDTIAAFRQEHLAVFEALFVEVVGIAVAMGLASFGLLGLDGSKVKANASKHKAMSYDRMATEIARLETEIAELLERAAQVDAEEDERFGDGHQQDIPAELARRQSRVAAIREAKTALEEEARQARVVALQEHKASNEAKAADPEVDPTERKRAASRAQARQQAVEDLGGSTDDDADDDGPSALPRHRVKHETDGTPKPKAQRNFTDPDSRIMVKDGNHVLQAYNVQVVVDSTSQIIVAQGVGNQAPDTHYFPGMVTRTAAVAAATGAAIPPDAKLVADAGYWAPQNVGHAEQAGFDPHIAVARTRHGPGPPSQVDEVDSTNPRDAMRQKLNTPQGAKTYSRRKVLPEPVFGQIKAARGFRTFLLRGLERVRGEWSLVCLAHNVLKLWRSEAVAA